MAAGMACLVATVRARQGRWQGTAITVFIAGLVCLDYAFLPGTSDLPPFPVLSTRPGRVLDPRLRSGATMYYQTEHERQLVGGYISRRSERALRSYRQMPGMNCLFFGDSSEPCDREVLLETLSSLEVRDVLLDPGDPRGLRLEEYGFERRYPGWNCRRRAATR